MSILTCLLVFWFAQLQPAAEQPPSPVVIVDDVKSVNAAAASEDQQPDQLSALSNEQRKKGADNEDNNCPATEPKSIDWFNPSESPLIVLAEVAICILAGAAAYSAKKSADFTLKTVEQMRLEQRAWIAFRHPQVFDVDTVGGHPEVVVKIRNSGATPAFIDNLESVGCFDEATEQQLDFLAKRLPAQMASGFGAEQSVIAPGSQQDSANLTGRIQTFYVVLRAQYRDAFGNQHATQTCFRYERGEQALCAHNKHNEMT
jgi:hypothetical protein